MDNTMSLFAKFVQKYKQSGERSKKSLINIILSFGAKGLSIVIQMLIVPLTINYVNPTRYGIWLTLSSIIAWIGFFDLGFGSGMRNKVAEAKAKGEVKTIREYVSTTYFAIGTIVICLFIVTQCINLIISWPSVLKVDAEYTEELRKVFSILSAFFCLDMVVKLFNSLLTADQKPGVCSCIGVIGQLFSLGMIFVLTKVSNGSLLSLAAFYSGIPTIVLLVVSVFAFHFTSYKHYAPHLRYVRRDLIKDIMNIGIQFFIIYLCMLIIFQFINLMISRELGPAAVTEYNVAYKYFNIAYSVMAIILSPFWSAFTDAYHKQDYVWMKKAKKALEIIWSCEVCSVILMIVISPWFYRIWIGDAITVRVGLTIIMSVYILAQSLGAVYMNLINGIGKIRLQLIIYIAFAIVSWPLMQYFCQIGGLLGILAVPTMAYSAQALLGKIQIEKLLKQNSKGIWNE